VNAVQSQFDFERPVTSNFPDGNMSRLGSAMPTPSEEG
jgi:hypothetical protein